MAYNNEYPSVDPYRYNSDWLLQQVLTLDQQWKNQFPPLQQQVNDQAAEIAWIKQQLEQIYNGDYAFLEEIIAKAIKNVWFGLTDTGYFVAYIPDSWDEITFRTSGLDYSTPLQPEYGHLILLY